MYFLFKDKPTSISINMKSLIIYGFMCFDYYEQWPEAHVAMNKLIQDVNKFYYYFNTFLY